jgi:hypothetical protein
MRRLRLFSLSCVLGVAACSNSETTEVGVPPTTAIAVDPAQFLGDVKCGDEPGDMRVFVASLREIGNAALVFPSSVPTSCRTDVLFLGVVDGREYEAVVDGYDRAGIQPLAKGNSAMVDEMTGEYVPPRWTTRCAHNRFPPSLRGTDGGLRADAGDVVYASTGYPDGGYDHCRPAVLYGPNDSPWLEGPICAANLATITARGCDPLRLAP